MLPRRTLHDVKVRLQKEPSIREMYVEGLYDRDFFKWILEKLGCNDVKVYPISVLDVSNDLVMQLGLTSGDRQRVQTAANAFSENFDLHGRLLFIIDSDMDYLLDKAGYQAPLKGTGGTSAELIFWKKQVLVKFAQMVLRVNNAEEFIEEMKSKAELVAKEFAIFRAAKERLGVNWNLISIEDAIDKRNDFSFAEYCQKVGNKNNAKAQMNDQFYSIVSALREKAKNLSIEKKVHGHDIISAFARKLKIANRNDACLKDADEFSRILMAISEWEMIVDDETVCMIKEFFHPRGTIGEQKNNRMALLVSFYFY